MIWFISDTHFGHKNIIRYGRGQFEDVKEMEELIIKNYNKKVKNKDLVYFVGDIFLNIKRNEAKKILNRLNGTKILIRGNHDKWSTGAYLDIGFSAVLESATLRLGKTTFLISHFPYRKPLWRAAISWVKWKLFGKRDWFLKYYWRRQKDSGMWLIHGHTHVKDKKIKKQINVCVDAWGFSPVNENMILKLVRE